MGLAEEKDANVSNLQKVHAIEHDLERLNRRLTIEEGVGKELEVEVV